MTGLVSAAVLLAHSFYSESRLTETMTSTQPPLHSAEQFEERFDRLLHAGDVSSQPGGTKLVIVVDNLDRCTREDEDYYGVWLSEGMPLGEYELVIGLYESSSGQRLPAFDGEGRRLPEDRIPLGKVWVRR